MNEIMFEIWVENQINRIDKKYMAEQITTEEYHEMINEVNRKADEFYTNLV